MFAILAAVAAAATASCQQTGTPDRDARAEGAAQNVLTVVVVDLQYAPVAGAEVLHTIPEPGEEARGAASRRLLTRDPAAWTAKFGRSLRTDESGYARIVVPEGLGARADGLMYVCARHGDGFDQHLVSWADAAGARIVLRLQRDIELVAKLVDSHDRPLSGVPLAARHAAEDDIDGSPPWVHDLGTTDDDGLLRSPHVQTWWRGVHARDGVRRVVLAPRSPWFQDVGTTVVLEHLQEDPVLVRMPPSGRIVVALDGWEDPGARDRPRVVVRPSGPEDSWPVEAVVDADGRVELGPVPLGWAWNVQLSSSVRAEEFDGPRADGEEVVFHVALPAVPVLTGRLLRDGRPLANETFYVCGDGLDLWARPGGHTDDAGRFRYELSTPDIGIVLSDVRCVVLGEGDSDALVGALSGRLELEAGDVDLGDVELAPAPPVLTGQLVGEWNPDEVQVWEVATDASGEKLAVYPLRTEIAAGGAFTVRGLAPTSPLRLIVLAPDHVPVPAIPFVPGQRDVEVVLQRGGIITLDVVVGDSRALVTLKPRIVPADGRSRASLQAGDSSIADHRWDRSVPKRPGFPREDPLTFRYEWTGVPPGRYRAEVLAWGTSETVLEIPDVVVEDGARVELEPVDVRRRVTNITLHFPDLDDTPPTAPDGFWSYGHLFVVEPGGVTSRCFSIDSPIADVAATGPLDLLVDVRGFRREVLRDVRADTEVRLEPGLALELTLESVPELPDGASVVVTAAPGEGAAFPGSTEVFSPALGDAFRSYSPPSSPCVGDGATRCAVVTAPGIYELSAELELATGRRIPLRITPARIEVGETGASAAVTVTREGR